ncbi:MAG: asparagine synthase-related protein, partial [Syntrophorhabdus sp.]
MRFLGVFKDGEFRGNPGPEKYRDCCILWRGYIGNREEIRREAQSRGLQSGDGSTGDLFVLAYMLWDTELQFHVTGEYSIVIFDTAVHKLFLTHDAFGLVPLFYGRQPGTLLVASHLEEIINHTGIGELDDEFIAGYIANPSLISNRTAYKNISRLAPGTSLVCTPGEEKVVEGRIFYQPGTSGEKDYVVKFLHLLGEGISAAMPAAGEVWCELSGGLDSSSIFSLTAREDTKRLSAFSIIYNRYGQADETKWIGAILDRYPAVRHTLEGDEALPYSEIPDRFCPEPGLYLVDWAGRRVYEKMASDHNVRVVLTGQGGDLVFFGIGPMPYYGADLAKALRIGQLVREIRHWKTSDRHRRSYLYWLIHYVIRPLIAHVLRQPIVPACHRDPSPWINPEYARKWSLHERGRGKPRTMKTVEHSWFMEQL